MARPSSPVLFLGGVALLWIGARLAVEMTGSPVAVVEKRADSAQAQSVAERTRRFDDYAVVAAVPRATTTTDWPPMAGMAPIQRQMPVRRTVSAQVAPLPITAAPVSRRAEPTASPTQAAPPALPLVVIAQPARSPSTRPLAPDRWTLSAWAFIRPMSAPTPLGQGLLGGSQAGARGAWRIDRHGRAEVYARLVSSGRFGDGVEAALGIAVKPLRAVPLRLSVERREQVVGSGGRSSMAAFASGGVSDVPLPLQLRLDGYAAAGVVGLRRRDMFAEGAVTVWRRVATIGPVDVEAGVGAWGAVQPDLERIDVGPGISARWRLGGVSPRLSLDWRQRVAGDAAPQSGVAVTLAADF